MVEEGQSITPLEEMGLEYGPNPTAACYFFRIAESLAGKNEVKLLSYVFSHKDILKVLVDRADVRPFYSLLTTLVHFTKDDDKIDASFKFLKYRFTLIRRIFETILAMPEGKEGISARSSDEMAAKERNLVKILEEFVLSKDKIVDSEYFLDKILVEKRNFKRLLQAVVAKQSPELLRLVGALMGHLFEKSNRAVLKKDEVAGAKQDTVKSEVPEEEIELDIPELKPKVLVDPVNFPRDTGMTSEPKLHNQYKEPQEPFLETSEATGEPGEGAASPERRNMVPPLTPDRIETPPNDLQEEDLSDNADQPQDNKSTAETSKGPIYNIEIDFYDNHELLKAKIVNHCHKCVQALLKTLLATDSGVSKPATSPLADERRPTGLYKITLVKFLATVMELQKVEDCIPAAFKPEVLTRLLSLFEENPANNLFHLHLARLLDIILAHAFLNAAFSVDINPLCDKLVELIRKTGPEASKTVRAKHLYRSSLLRLAGTIKTGLEASVCDGPSPPKAWKELADFLAVEQKILDNKLFVPVSRSFGLAQDNLPDNFEINNFKINQIIEKRQRQQLIDEDMIEDSPTAYQSNHNDVNMEMLNNLINNLAAETDRPAESEDISRDVMGYEVELDLGSDGADSNEISSPRGGEVRVEGNEVVGERLGSGSEKLLETKQFESRE